MKLQLLSILFLASFSSFSQCWIELNQTSCGTSTSTIEILSGTFYDEYQWFYKPISSSGDFQMIPGANNPNLIFDWSNFENSLIKVFVATESYSYDSNIIEISNQSCLLKTSDFTSQNIKLFPNPTYDRLYISEVINGFKIFNMLGKEIISEKLLVTNEIDIAALLPGVYFLNIEITDRSNVFKFVKK